MLDSNVFDKLVDDRDALALVRRLVESGEVVLLSTHVQADEIARTPDLERRALLMSIPVQHVPTFGFALDYSRLGAARLGDSELLESLRRDNLENTEDALIGATAVFEQATLVSEDRTLAKRARAQGIDVLDWSQFHERMRELDGDASAP